MSGQRYQQLQTGNSPSPAGHKMDEKNAKSKSLPSATTTHRSWQATVLTQVFALLWIVPILLLLVFNLHGYIIGASAWCPSKDCYPQLFNPDTAYTQDLLLRYNEESHNLLGALQLASKALEVWFEVIASFLVYLVTMEIASKKEGLGVGYIMTSFEYSRLPFVFDFMIYKIAPSLLGQKTKSAKAYRRRIYLLLLLAFFLCGICNLMGPSTAVLILPTLQWITTHKVGNSSFVDMNASNPPTTSGWFFQYLSQFQSCTADEVTAGNYSCSQYPLGGYFDSWIGSAQVSGAWGITQQDSVSFSLNNTYQPSTRYIQDLEFKDAVYWSPNRQVVSELDNDLDVIAAISYGYNKSYVAEGFGVSESMFDTYAEYNKSLDVYVQRSGPILGAIPNYWYKYSNQTEWTVDLGADQQLRCYSHYLLDLLVALEFSSTASYENFTKCITIGMGWSAVNKVENFTIAGAQNYSTGSPEPATTMTVYSSNEAFFLPNGTIPSWMPSACFTNGTIPAGTQCDWPRLAAENEGYSSAVNRSRTNVNTIEMQLQNGTLLAVINFVAHLSMAVYTLDASPISNPYWNIQNQGTIDTNDTTPIDPAWILAAWSAYAGGTMLPNRTSTMMVADLMRSITYEGTGSGIVSLAVLSAAQTLSLIDFSTKPATPSEDPRFLYRNARINVYAYQISSRTAVLGTIVAIIGIVVTLIEFVLALVFRRPFRSSTQILISALSHAPREEFDEKGDEVEEGKVRFHVLDSSRERLAFRHMPHV